jgi:RHS repeat-associated protein
LDLELTLTYNSLIWTKDGSFIKFNADLGTPAPGFRLGFPTLQQKFLNPSTGIYAYLMVMPSGSRVELRQIGSTTTYEAADGSYTQLDATTPTAPIVTFTNGTRLTFVSVTINSEFRCTQIKDRNGNFISASYNGTNGHMETVTDTLGRVFTFVYDASQNLTAIRQTWAGGSHDWATFYYGQVFVAPAFGGGLAINGPNNNYTTVLTQVNLHDGSYYTFNYNNAFAQVFRINRYAADTHLLAYTSYNLSTAAGQTDCPRFTERRDWAENWNNHLEAVTSYSAAVDGSWSQQTTPDGTIYKEIYFTSGWQKGLPSGTEVKSGGVVKKSTTITWTQDNTGLTYPKNVRPTDLHTYDDAGNHRRVSTTYTTYNLPNPVTLPTEIKEYAADGTTVLRRTTTTYIDAQAYIDRRVLGLTREVIVYDGANQPQSKTWFDYDWANEYWAALPAAATQHDSSGTQAGRGNLVWIGRWDVTDVNNSSKILNSYTKYNRTGSVIKTEDHFGQGTSISYTDAFSDGVPRNTFAYPTTTTDAELFNSTTQYNFDHGAITRVQDPKGAVQTITYDSAARRSQVTDQTTGAYTRYSYATANTFTAAHSTIESGQGEGFEGTAYDGMGRYRATQVDMPGSAGGYATTIIGYDVMGRPRDRSKPTEMTAFWIPSGDDAATGFVWTTQSYDWLSRPTSSLNPDGSTTENTYGGCGCAGGEVTTVRDENGRRKRYTTDVLGRMTKVEELNWDQTVYSTTNLTYNVRDQLLTTNQEGQIRSFGYDGYGRINTRTTPEQGTSTYTYYQNNMLQSATDARGASTTLLYNGRGLVTNINYSVSGSVAATPNITFGYDSNGNRTSMTDALGSITYAYNTLSQMTSETRTFTGLAGSYGLTYTYGLAGQLKTITNPWGAQIGYNYDKIGRLASVSGSGYAGVSSYVSSFAYRAFGPKQISYANGRTLSLQYDNRMRPTEWSTPGVLRMQYSYTWEKSGRVEFARNLDDETLDRWFAYDHVGRLIVSRSGNEARLAIGEQVPLLYNGPYSHGYFYDKFGNITGREGWGGTNPAYTVSFNNNKMNGHTYDASGNLTDAGGGWTFTYDANSQQITSAVNGVLNVYDGERLRGKKTEGGVTFYYLRSSVLNGQIVAEIASNGDWHRGFVYLGADLLAVQSAGVYWVHQDPVVKSKRITNSSGTIVSTIELDPWGGETNRSSNEAFQPQKFNTYHRDGIGSDDAMNRRYNRWWTRFEQPDPFDGSYNLKDPQSYNRYAYGQNDPITSTDPTGLMPMMCGLYMQYMNGDPIGYGFVCFGPNIPFEPFEPKPGGGGPGPTPTPTVPQQTPQQQKLCNDLGNRIQQLRDELAKRADDLVKDKNNLPATGRNSVAGHQQQFQNKQTELRNKLNDFQTNGCGGGTPADAWKFATMPTPSPAKKPNPIPIIITPGPKPIPVTPIPVPPIRPAVPFFVPLPWIIIKCVVFRDCGQGGPRQA